MSDISTNITSRPGYGRNSYTKQIYTIDDFPAPVSMVITLEDNTTYEFNEDISTVNRFEIPFNSKILFRTKRSNQVVFTYTGTGTLFTNVPATPTNQFEIDDMIILITDIVTAKLFDLSGTQAFESSVFLRNFRYDGVRLGTIRNFGVFGMNFSSLTGIHEQGLDLENCQFHSVFNNTLTGLLPPAGTGNANLLTIRGPATTQCFYGNVLAFPLSAGERTILIEPDISPFTEMEINRFFSQPTGRYFRNRDVGEFTEIASTTKVNSVLDVTENGGAAQFNTAANHTYSTGDQIIHTNFNPTQGGPGFNYNGNFLVNVIDANSYTVTILDFNPGRGFPFPDLGDDSGDSNFSYRDFTTTNTTGLVIGEGVKITDTLQNDGIFIVRLLSAGSSFSVSAPFTITEAGKWNIGSLDEKDKRVIMTSNGFQKDSKTIAIGFMNGESQNTGITDGTYGPLTLSNFESNVVTERFTLIDAAAAVFRYDGLTPFEGILTATIVCVPVTANDQNYRFAMSLNGAIPLFTGISPAVTITMVTGVVNAPAVFTHGGDNPPVGSVVTLSTFTAASGYNVRGVVSVSGAGTFEIAGVLFRVAGSGLFEAADANYLPIRISQNLRASVALLFSGTLLPNDTIQIMAAGDGTSNNLTIFDIVIGVQ